MAYKASPIPMTWMLRSSLRSYVENIRKGLSQVDPRQRRRLTGRNAAAYRAQLPQARSRTPRRLGRRSPPRRRLLAPCEAAISYSWPDYGLQEAYLWPVNAESQVDPKRMARFDRPGCRERDGARRSCSL